jgi:hypothetical protein
MSIIKKNVLSKTKKYMCPSQNEQKGEKGEHDDDHHDTLTNEIDSWNNFEYALREEKTDCSLTRCYSNARKMKITSELLALKMNSSELN